MKYLGYVAVSTVLCFSSITTHAQTIPDSTNEALMLAGIKVNGVDKDTIEILKKSNLINNSQSYYLPFNSMLDYAGLVSEPVATGYVIKTPIGQATLTKSALFTYQNNLYVDIAEIKKLGITADYNAADLAVNLNIPWDSDELKSPTSASKKITPIADYLPTQAGFLGISWDINANQQRSNNHHPKATVIYSELGAFGYAMGGIWGVNSQLNANDTNNQSKAERYDSHLTNLYWAKSGDKLATRFGVNQSGLSHQLLNEYTGVSLAYSNKNIGRHLASMDETTHSLLQGSYEDLQHIEGKGPVGGVAELRINGQAVARVQIGLDERYEFLNLDMNQWLSATTAVEVALFDYPSAKQPISIRRLNLGKRLSNAATGELIVESNFGKSGNILDNTDTDYSTLASLYSEYGINNRLAIRGGISHAHTTSWETGFNLTTSPRSNLDLNYLHQSNDQEIQADWQYQNKKFFADYQYIQRQYAAITDILKPKSTKNVTDKRHSLYLNYQPSPSTSLSVNQYYNQLANHTDYYYTILANRQLNSQWNTGFSWDSRGDKYSYRLSWQHPNQPVSLGYLGDNDENQLTLQHRLNNQWLLTHTLSKLYSNNDVLYGLNASYQPNDYQLINVGWNTYQGEQGWEASWRYAKHNGLSITAGYRQHALMDIRSDLTNVDTSQSDLHQDHYAYLQLSMDWWKPPASPIIWGRYESQQQGSMVIDVNHPKGIRIDNDQIRFNLNDKSVNASLIHQTDNQSQYLINQIKAGVYRLSIDNKNIPIEYNTDLLPMPYVKVADFTPTLVPLTLNKSYGISGDVADKKANVSIDIWQDNQLISSQTTDETGHYQFFGLVNGRYQMKAQGYQPVDIGIQDDFVLNKQLLPITP